MTAIRVLATSAALACSLGGPAAAEGFAVMDLGEMPDRQLCMQKGVKVVDAYLREHGGAEVVRTDWVVYGWDLLPGDQDVTVLCPILRGDLVNAFLVVYGETTDPDRDFTAQEIERLWMTR